MKRMLMTAGLVAAAAVRGWGDAPPAAAPPPTPAAEQAAPATGAAFEQRLAAMEQELEELKMAQAEEAAKAKAPGTFRSYWDKGLKFETADKAFKMQIGGRLQYDLGWISQDALNKDAKKGFGDMPDGSEFRRLRLEVQGDFYNNGFFKLQFDFAGGSANVKDMYVGIKKVPVFGSLYAGHMYEPFGLDTNNSSKYIQFMERSLLHEAFCPDRQNGLAFANSVADDRLYYKFGVFRTASDFGVVNSDAGYSMTGRITGLPWYQDDGKYLLHLGLAGSLRTAQDAHTLQFRTRPEWHLATKRFVDTGTIKNVDSNSLLGAELAMNLGSFNLQSEFIATWVSSQASSGQPDYTFSGFYVEGSYWLTGEYRPYKKTEGVFDRVTPKNNFAPGKGGWGAWQVAVRYSSIDLNDGIGKYAVKGGKERDLTVGLNWHLNPNQRVMFNWVHALTSEPDKGAANMFGVRYQIDF